MEYIYRDGTNYTSHLVESVISQLLLGRDIESNNSFLCTFLECSDNNTWKISTELLSSMDENVKFMAANMLYTKVNITKKSSVCFDVIVKVRKNWSQLTVEEKSSLFQYLQLSLVSFVNDYPMIGAKKVMMILHFELLNNFIFIFHEDFFGSNVLDVGQYLFQDAKVRFLSSRVTLL